MDINKVIEDRLSIFVRMYDTMRVVDPIAKTVFGKGCEKCYELLGRERPCDNCTSMRALQMDETTIKIEPYQSGYEFMMSIPVIYEGDRYIAELVKYYSSEGINEALSVEDNNKLEQEIARLSRELIIDPMTEVYNKRFISERMPVEFNYASKKNQELYLVMCDIDFFKKVNDTYGHLAGDDVLKFFAEELKRYFQHGSNWVARFGGEEFILCIQDSSKDKLSKKLNTFINTLGQLSCTSSEGYQIKITASFGVAKWDGESTEAFIEAADKLLYKAKENGRNRFEM